MTSTITTAVSATATTRPITATGIRQSGGRWISVRALPHSRHHSCSSSSGAPHCAQTPSAGSVAACWSGGAKVMSRRWGTRLRGRVRCVAACGAVAVGAAVDRAAVLAGAADPRLAQLAQGAGAVERELEPSSRGRSRPRTRPSRARGQAARGRSDGARARSRRGRAAGPPGACGGSGHDDGSGCARRGRARRRAAWARGPGRAWASGARRAWARRHGRRGLRRHGGRGLRRPAGAGSGHRPDVRYRFWTGSASASRAIRSLRDPSVGSGVGGVPVARCWRGAGARRAAPGGPGRPGSAAGSVSVPRSGSVRARGESEGVGRPRRGRGRSRAGGSSREVRVPSSATPAAGAVERLGRPSAAHRAGWASGRSRQLGWRSGSSTPLLGVPSGGRRRARAPAGRLRPAGVGRGGLAIRRSSARRLAGGCRRGGGAAAGEAPAAGCAAAVGAPVRRPGCLAGDRAGGSLTRDGGGRCVLTGRSSSSRRAEYRRSPRAPLQAATTRGPSGRSRTPRRARGPATRGSACARCGASSRAPRRQRRTVRSRCPSMPASAVGCDRRPAWRAPGRRRRAPRARPSPNPSRSEGTSTALAALTHSGTSVGPTSPSASSGTSPATAQREVVALLGARRDRPGTAGTGPSGSSPSARSRLGARDRLEAVRCRRRTGSTATLAGARPARDLARRAARRPRRRGRASAAPRA